MDNVQSNKVIIVTEDKVWDLLADINETNSTLLGKVRTGKISSSTYHQLVQQLRAASSETIGNRRLEVFAKCKAAVSGIQQRMQLV